jgi:Ca-activated chloride channel family protein
MTNTRKRRWRPAITLPLGGLVVVLAVGTLRDPCFWLTAEQRGDRLMAREDWKRAASAYADPWHVGTALYRHGDFDAAASMFARVPGANGAFDRGNALLMHGSYDEAIASYDRALGFQPGWKEAQDNRDLAAARKKASADAGKDRQQESAGAYDADEIVVAPTGADRAVPAPDTSGEGPSDAELRATWLRRVRTTPGQFLRAKFTYEAASASRAGSTTGGEKR